MEFVVIVLFVAAIVLVNFLVSRAQRKRASRPAETKPAESASGSDAKATRTPAGTSLDAAREAVARLDEQGHQQVYAAIAQGQPIRAIQLYAQRTGCGLRAASAAVASMASHPVPFIRPEHRQPPAQEPAEAQAESTLPEEPAADAGAAENQPPAGRDTAENDAPARSTAGSAASAAGKDTPQDKAKDKDLAAPDDAEISKWAQNLRPEDF